MPKAHPAQVGRVERDLPTMAGFSFRSEKVNTALACAIRSSVEGGAATALSASAITEATSSGDGPCRGSWDWATISTATLGLHSPGSVDLRRRESAHRLLPSG